MPLLSPSCYPGIQPNKPSFSVSFSSNSLQYYLSSAIHLISDHRKKFLADSQVWRREAAPLVVCKQELVTYAWAVRSLVEAKRGDEFRLRRVNGIRVFAGE